MFNITLPDLSDISDKQNLEKIKGYLATLNDQLRYMMLNIDEENLSDSLSDTIKTAEKTSSEAKISLVRLGERISKVTQTADKINWLISNGKSSTDFTLTSTAARLISNSIDMTGYARFTDLSGTGTSVINGNNILTGTISADKLSVSTLESISANIGGWSISGNSITSSVSGCSFSINSASSSDSCWIRAKNSYGNTTFYISKNGGCYFNGSYISGGSITADKLSSDSNLRLNLLNNYNGIHIGKDIYMSSSTHNGRIFINPAGVMTFDTGVGTTPFSFGLSRNGNVYSLTLYNGSGSVVGNIPIQ